MPDISVVVAVYKDAEALGLILDALERQSYQDFEVIVAQDCESDEIKECVKSHARLNIKHTTQKDDGWRKNASINNAIRVSDGELIVFIDGDCIPNEHFIKEYNSLREENTVLCGRRIELGSKYSAKLREKSLNILDLQKNYIFNIFDLLKDDTRHYEEGIYLSDFLYNLKHKNKSGSVLGCNFGVNKKDLVEINGFNEDYTAPSVGEDTDIEYRLKLKGCSFKRVRNKAFVFHLYHKEVYDSVANEKSMKVFNRVKEAKEMVCEHGLSR